MPSEFPVPPPLGGKAEEVSTDRVPFRFSIRSLFRVMTALALLFGFGAVFPVAFSQIILGAFWIVVSGWLITGIVFAQGDARAFCIGATVVATSMWTGVGGRFAGGIQGLLRGVFSPHGAVGSLGDAEGLGIWIIHLILAAVAVGNGYLCILARRYFERLP